jgi:hypothetical protein
MDRFSPGMVSQESRNVLALHAEEFPFQITTRVRTRGRVPELQLYMMTLVDSYWGLLGLVSYKGKELVDDALVNRSHCDT